MMLFISKFFKNFLFIVLFRILAQVFRTVFIRFLFALLSFLLVNMSSLLKKKELYVTVGGRNNDFTDD